MVTNMISQLQDSFPLRRVVFYVEISSLSIKQTEHEFYLFALRVSLTRERYFQHSKVKFLSPRNHVISPISVRRIVSM